MILEALTASSRFRLIQFGTSFDIKDLRDRMLTANYQCSMSYDSELLPRLYALQAVNVLWSELPVVSHLRAPMRAEGLKVVGKTVKQAIGLDEPTYFDPNRLIRSLEPILSLAIMPRMIFAAQMLTQDRLVAGEVTLRTLAWCTWSLVAARCRREGIVVKHNSINSFTWIRAILYFFILHESCHVLKRLQPSSPTVATYSRSKWTVSGHLASSPFEPRWRILNITPSTGIRTARLISNLMSLLR